MPRPRRTVSSIASTRSPACTVSARFVTGRITHRLLAGSAVGAWMRVTVPQPAAKVAPTSASAVTSPRAALAAGGRLALREAHAGLQATLVAGPGRAAQRVAIAQIAVRQPHHPRHERVRVRELAERRERRIGPVRDQRPRQALAVVALFGVGPHADVQLGATAPDAQAGLG